MEKGNDVISRKQICKPVFQDYKRIFFLLIAISLFFFSCTPTRLFRSPESERIYENLNRLLHSLGPEYGVWGSMVIDLNSGDTLLNVNSNIAFTPASLTKLFTVAAGSETKLKIQNAVLFSSPRIFADYSVDTLYLQGGGFTLQGDGNIDSLLSEGIAALLENGITSVNKTIVIEHPTDNETFHPGWTMDDFSGYYASTPSFFSARSNLWQITIQRKPDSIFVDIIPDSHFKPAVRVDESDKFYYGWQFGEYQIPYFQIDLRPGDKSRNIFIPMFQPAHVWAEQFKKRLVMAGFCDDNLPLIYVSDMDGEALRTIKIFETLTDDSLYTLALRYSDNFVAGQLLRSLGYARNGVYGRDSGLVAMDSALLGLNLQKGRDYSFWDGSGMSRYNWVTTEALVKVLFWYHSKTILNRSMAMSGQDGTLENRLGDFSAAIKISGKTGSMRGVRNFAGFVAAPGNRRYLIVFMVNHFTLPAPEIDKVMRRIILTLSAK